MKWTLWALLPAFVLAWTAQELEIFNLRDAVVKDFGDDATFYSWLGLDSKADHVAISKAYRKLSREIHPDKMPLKGAEERYSRLNRVHKILRSEGRDTYDFYLRHGFPTLRDGDYLFSRYRPGLLVALLVVLATVTVVHFAILKTRAHRQRQFVRDVITEVQDIAKGPVGIISSKKRVKLENGKEFVVHPEGTVFLLDNEDELLVTEDDVEEPAFTDTILFFPFSQRDAASTSSPKLEKEKEKKSAAAAPDELKKGAARRRPAGPRGKAKIF